jgi:rubredoxin
MEMSYYKCPVCGFIYQVPEYWSGFSPEEKMELQHYNLETKEMCRELMLELVKIE